MRNNTGLGEISRSITSMQRDGIIDWDFVEMQEAEQLLDAAMSLLHLAQGEKEKSIEMWPWSEEHELVNLVDMEKSRLIVNAGALIALEVERRSDSNYSCSFGIRA